jgi:ankyrin repeat protein
MNSDTEELYEACAVGDVQRTMRALAKAPDVNSREWDSRFTPLHVCIAGMFNQEQRREIVRLLCKAGARLDLKDERRWTPLMFSAVRDKSLCAEALLECGADVHAANEDGATALHHAAFQGHVEVAKVLLRFGGDAVREDANGCTPAYLARSQGHAELEQLLLSPPKSSGKPWWRLWR